jgi:hypothetical protein
VYAEKLVFRDPGIIHKLPREHLDEETPYSRIGRSEAVAEPGTICTIIGSQLRRQAGPPRCFRVARDSPGGPLRYRPARAFETIRAWEAIDERGLEAEAR